MEELEMEMDIENEQGMKEMVRVEYPKTQGVKTIETKGESMVSGTAKGDPPKSTQMQTERAQAPGEDPHAGYSEDDFESDREDDLREIQYEPTGTQQRKCDLAKVWNPKKRRDKSCRKNGTK